MRFIAFLHQQRIIKLQVLHLDYWTFYTINTVIAARFVSNFIGIKEVIAVI